MNNPLPVDRFSVAEAARRTWPMLIESMLEAVCLLEPEGLRIVAANAAAARLFGLEPAELVGRAMPAMAATPEDECFWRELTGLDRRDQVIASESLILNHAGSAVPVLRRISRVEPSPGTALYVLALHDRRAQVEAERAAEVAAAGLAATLESVADGVLVTDLAGRIGHFNRRFAELWELPAEMLARRADDDVFDWMRSRVRDPATYMRRLAEIELDALGGATDLLRLNSGAVVERATQPQRSRGRAIGRVFSFRVVAAGFSGA